MGTSKLVRFTKHYQGDQSKKDETGEMHTKCWLENLKGREQGRPRRRWWNNIRMDLR
jgi:hypothetical protein